MSQVEILVWNPCNEWHWHPFFFDKYNVPLFNPTNLVVLELVTLSRSFKALVKNGLLK